MEKDDTHNESDDTVLEEENEDGESSGVDAATIMKKLREKLKVCEREKKDYLTGWQREKADFINARKDDEKRMSERVRFAPAGVLLDLLPALDSFDMAFANKEAWEATPENWRQGITHIHAQLVQALNAHGVKALDPAGERFDPGAHLSAGAAPVEESDRDGIILRVIQKGYALNGDIIRPARVEVGEYGKSE